MASYICASLEINMKHASHCPIKITESHCQTLSKEGKLTYSLQKTNLCTLDWNKIKISKLHPNASAREISPYFMWMSRQFS